MNRNKLEEIRKGPLKILRRISNFIYEVDNGNRRSDGNFFHSRVARQAVFHGQNDLPLFYGRPFEETRSSQTNGQRVTLETDKVTE